MYTLPPETNYHWIYRIYKTLCQKRQHVNMKALMMIIVLDYFIPETKREKYSYFLSCFFLFFSRRFMK